MSVTLLEEALPESALEPTVAAPVTPAGDTLAASVVILLVMTVAQRFIGFGRGILFCRWLDPEQLGQWDVAFGFLNLAAPLAVFGLPGSFGRYVEYYRQRGQFGTFLRRMTWVNGVMCIVAATLMIFQRDWFSSLIFGSHEETSLVVWLAVCLATVIGHNFLVSLFIAMRRYRVVTALQFVQSVGFALVSVALLVAWPAGPTSVVVGYALATVLSALGAYTWIRSLVASQRLDGPPVTQSAFWAKLLPFAMWMWVTNLLANLFEVIDRYMIIHHSGLASNEALRLVGSYHSSRLVPLLFVAIAGLLGLMITPHLSHDWEVGRRHSVERRLNLMLKVLLASLFSASVAVEFIAPWLFGVAFQNKFAGGLEVLPWTLSYCIWFGTISVAQNYLWCAERPGLCTFSLFLGLLLNIACNLVLLPRMGLEGAVWATTVANFTALSLIYFFSARQGMHVDAGTWLLTVAPMALWLGAWPALCVALVIGTVALLTTRVVTADEKGHLAEAFSHGFAKAKQFVSRRSIRPTAV